MKTNPVPPRLPPPPGAQSKPAPKPNGSLHVKLEYIQKYLDRLPKEKQNYALGLFPKDSTGHSVKIDEDSYKAFMNILDRKEQRNFTWILPNLKDSRRLTEEPAPGARRPAKGEDLSAPLDFRGKPIPESAKLQPMPLADLLAAEKAGQDTHVPPKTQTQGQPNRVGFSDVAPVRLIPKGEDFNPGEFHPGWPHQLSEGPKPKVVKPNASNAKFKPVLRISLPESTVSMDGRPGREAPYPLNNKSYPTPSPKGILKKAGPGTGSPDSTPPASPSTPSAPLIPSTAQETETKEAGTKKELLGNVAALGAALTVTAVVAPGLISAAKEEDSSSSGQSEA